MSESRAVLLLSQFYAPERVGSAPYMTDLAEWLAERGVEVDVACADPHYPDYRRFPGWRRSQDETTSTSKIRIHRMPTLALGRGGFLTRIVLESGVALGTLFALLTRRLPRRDTVISLCPSILMVAVGILARRRRGTHVAILHDIQSGLAAGLGIVRFAGVARLMRFVERTVLNRVDQVVVLTDTMRDVLLRMGVRRPIHVLPIWVDPDEIVPLPKQGTKLQVQYSGNLGRKQGLDQVLDLAERLLASRPDVEVLIRGRGSLLEMIRAATSQRALTNIRLTDLVPATALPQALAEGDVHVVPQAEQGADFAVPSKLASVLAAGRPAVCTAAPGTPLWQIGSQCSGVLCVPPGDLNALHETVTHLLDAPRHREQLGRAGRVWVENNLGRTSVLERLAAVAFLQLGPAQSRSKNTLLCSRVS